MKKKLLVAFLSAMIGIQGVLPVMAEEELVPEEIIVEDITEEDQEIFLEEPDLIIEEEPFLEELISDPEESYALEDSLEEEETENVERKMEFCPHDWGELFGTTDFR